jgi:low affinity Fe/Cu permease
MDRKRAKDGDHSKRSSRATRAHKAHLARAREVNAHVTSRSPFLKFARAISGAVGKPWAFISAVIVVLGWAVSGPIFGYSDTWQLVINTSTTIITFLMVFLIQNTQNRDTEALRLKLDELILAVDGARNEFVDIDDLDDDELKALEADMHARVREES